MRATIITSGQKYLDIDALAGMFAYRELMRACGHQDTFAISSAPYNQSVPPSLQKFYDALDHPASLPEADFIMIDVSNPEFFDSIVDPERIVMIIDHHTGFEEYWHEKIGHYAQIEFIGSVCTIIFERIAALDKLEILTPELCQLMAAGILDNTLNFHSEITTERDVIVYQELVRRGKLPPDFAKLYFEECFKSVKTNIAAAIKNDLKIEDVAPILPRVIGQLIVPELKDFDLAVLPQVFTQYDAWAINVISLLEGKSYLYYGGEGVEQNLERLFGVKAISGHLELTPCLLRKQIMNQARKCKG